MSPFLLLVFECVHCTLPFKVSFDSSQHLQLVRVISEDIVVFKFSVVCMCDTSQFPVIVDSGLLPFHIKKFDIFVC